jgi:hypothetical protein
MLFYFNYLITNIIKCGIKWTIKEKLTDKRNKMELYQ